MVLAFITAHARTIFGRTDVATSGVDVNSFACAATRQTVDLAIKESTAETGTFLDAVTGDLMASIRPGCVDVLVFNPPYVPSETVPSSTKDLEGVENSLQRDWRLSSLATDGGFDGMEITRRLFDELPVILSGRGVGYVLLCAQNRPRDVMASIRSWGGSERKTWLVEMVGRSGKKAGWENLCVLRIWRDEHG